MGRVRLRMALRRKKSSQRKEPQFGLGASLASLRLNIADRISIASDDKPKSKKTTKRESSGERAKKYPGYKLFLIRISPKDLDRYK